MKPRTLKFLLVARTGIFKNAGTISDLIRNKTNLPTSEVSSKMPGVPSGILEGGVTNHMRDLLPVLSEIGGARRAGEADALASAMGDKASILVRYPWLTQALGAGAGTMAVGRHGPFSVTSTGISGGPKNVRSLIGGLIGNTLVNAARSLEMRGIKNKFNNSNAVDLNLSADELRGAKRSLLSRFFLPFAGQHQLGAAETLAKLMGDKNLKQNRLGDILGDIGSSGKTLGKSIATAGIDRGGIGGFGLAMGGGLQNTAGRLLQSLGASINAAKANKILEQLASKVEPNSAA